MTTRARNRTRRSFSLSLESLDERIAPSAMVFAMAAHHHRTHAPARPPSFGAPTPTSPTNKAPARPPSFGAPTPTSPTNKGPATPPSFSAPHPAKPLR